MQIINNEAVILFWYVFLMLLDCFVLPANQCFIVHVREAKCNTLSNLYIPGGNIRTMYLIITYCYFSLLLGLVLTLFWRSKFSTVTLKVSHTFLAKQIQHRYPQSISYFSGEANSAQIPSKYLIFSDEANSAQLPSKYLILF